MPELPDLAIYRERLDALVGGHTLEALRIGNPFVLRSVTPAAAELHGRRVTGTRRIGKRLVLVFDDTWMLVMHLMIAGRLRWRPPAATGTVTPPPAKMTLAALVFAHGTLFLTEAGSTRRASMHIVRGEDALTAFDRGGLEPLDASEAAFVARLRDENHTLKRALTDPRLFSGIGNAYSDEILHAAQLSPLTLTSRLGDDEARRLYAATRDTLTAWIARTRDDVGAGFPDTVTAFRDGMAVHGRYGQPCPRCGAPVQRIRYADNETNYCARCQTGGRLLADRAISRLLGADRPRTLDELED